MAGRNFDKWFETFRESINGYEYYIDFEKAHENAKKLKAQICMLDALIASENIEEDFKQIIKEAPKCLKAIPILLAVRENEIYCQDEKGGFYYNFSYENQSIDQYIYFMKKTGLFNMLQKHLIRCLYDYVMGVEVGLDSNGRKNRGGHQMENLVEKYLIKSGVNYRKEIYLTEIEKLWNIDLSAISSEGTVNKRWDFAIKTENKVYVIETNFYSSGGSKLNETARSYKMIAQEAKNINDFEFVWITDGKGWKSAKNNLQETFNVLENLYNIKDMENGIFDYL